MDPLKKYNIFNGENIALINLFNRKRTRIRGALNDCRQNLSCKTSCPYCFGVSILLAGLS
ncbi:hypothetical protein HZS_3917 [Henneguya salminicola]|nr:hypothetical protein HZS_3917 [Henneguya salminicola]